MYPPPKKKIVSKLLPHLHLTPHSCRKNSKSMVMTCKSIHDWAQLGLHLHPPPHHSQQPWSWDSADALHTSVPLFILVKTHLPFYSQEPPLFTLIHFVQTSIIAPTKLYHFLQRQSLKKKKKAKQNKNQPGMFGKLKLLSFSWAQGLGDPQRSGTWNEIQRF